MNLQLLRKNPTTFAEMMCTLQNTIRHRFVDVSNFYNLQHKLMCLRGNRCNFFCPDRVGLNSGAGGCESAAFRRERLQRRKKILKEREEFCWLSSYKGESI